MRIGVMGALPEEIKAFAAMLGESRVEQHGGRDYTIGSLHGHEVVCVPARIGKVAAALATAELIVRYAVDRVVVTGLAGALSPELHPGDVVVGAGFVQHDMDASPLFPTLEVPLTGMSRFVATPEIAAALTAAAENVLADLSPLVRERLARDSTPPRVWTGDIATGDRFVSGGAPREGVTGLVPDALCAEMEGAAVAQACSDYGVSFGVVRVISDRADGSAAPEFMDALRGPVTAITSGIVERVLRTWA